MPLTFKLDQRLAGLLMNAPKQGEKAEVLYRDLVPPTDAARVLHYLEQLQNCLFGFIKGFPPASAIDHFIITISRDLSGTAYVNELNFKARVKLKPEVNMEVGHPVLVSEIEDIVGMALDVDIPRDAAVVVMRSFGWRRSIFFDFGPLAQHQYIRPCDIESVLAQQQLMLLGLHPGHPPLNPFRIVEMEAGIEKLRGLLQGRCDKEAAYQELILQHPWMLGGGYSRVDRHTTLDDRNVPDFTAVRAHDGFRDIIEIKQPFASCFREDGEPASALNDAWNQAERYLLFSRRNRDYLRSEKQLEFHNPRCIVLAGYQWSQSQLERLREKESLSVGISVLTYDQLLQLANGVLALIKRGTGHGETARDEAG